MSATDLSRLCEYLAVDEEEFERDYGERAHGKLRVRTGNDGYCIFFSTGKGCSIHVAKPDVCRAWPFFRGNLVDPVSLSLAKDYCPGIPRDISFEDFVQEGCEYLEEEQLDHESGHAHALDITGVLNPKKS